jgi:GT2 family glycosyltransferase
MKTREEQTLVSIITVNYNQSEVTMALLESLRKISYSNTEVIVVDNASPNDNPDLIKEKYPEIHLIKSKENLGFSGGNNLGIYAASGKYMLFINNDTEVPENFLEPLVKVLDEHEEVGVVSPKIRFYFHPDIIQYAGYTPLNYITMRNHLVGYRQKDEGQFNQAGYTPFGHGAAMMVPRKVMEEVGLMADIFFLYYEEHDWFERIKRAGYKIYYEPASLVMHKESMSTGKESPLKIHYIARNRLVFMRRNISGPKFLIAFLFQTFVSTPKGYLNYLLKGQFKLLMAFHRAIMWNLRHTFDKEIQANNKLNSKNI